jgi:tetratricopeptide (TPR) repeat protein/O-antigen ligase
MTKIKVRQGIGWLAEREFVCVFLAAPWLLFPDLVPSLTSLALVAIPALWLFRSVARRPVHVSTPVNLPIFLMLLSIGVAVLTAPLVGPAVGNATVIVLGVAIVSALVNGDDSWRRVQVWSVVLTVGGFLFALFSLLVTDWPQGKISALGRLSARLPALGSALRPGSMAGLDPGQVSGVLVLLLPIAVGFAFDALRRGKQPLMSHWQVFAGAGFLAVLGILLALVLTQSRTALVVLVAVGAIVLSFRSRPAGVLVVAFAVTFAMLLLIGLFSNQLDSWMRVIDGVGRPPDALPTAWSGRVELWRNALLVMRDYPLTGAGLGAFIQVALVNYPFHSMTPDLPATVPNLWLHAGVDLGLLGILAFAWLTASILLMGWKIHTRRNGERVLLTGFWFGLVAWMGHGLLTGLWLGEGLGILVWIVIGVLLGGWLGEDEPPLLASNRGRFAGAGWAAGGLLAAGVLGWLFLGPVWSLNRGAHLLDKVLVDASLGVQERAVLLDESQSLFDQSGDLPGVVRRKGLVEYEAGEDDLAIVSFREDPGAEAFLSSRASWLLSDGQVDEADRLLKVATAAVLDSARLSCLRAEVLWARGDPFAAVASYRRGVGLSAGLDDGAESGSGCHEGFASLTESLGWWDEAAKSLARAAELEPGNLEYRRRYGWALFRATGDLGEPVAIEEAALRAGPDSVPVMLMLIDIYLAADRPQKALDWSQAAIGVDEANSESWLRLAMAYSALEESDQAINALAEALRLDPGNLAALDLRARWGAP